MVVAITGASSGIGRALAFELGARDACLALAARRIDRLEDINRELGNKHLCVRGDVSSPPDCAQFIEKTINHYGRIDTLVCNAGYGFPRPFAEMSRCEIEKIFQTNLFGTTECCRAAIPQFRRQDPRDGFRGQIMIVSSACARRGLPFFSTYAATKAAQLSFAEGLRIEMKPLRIAVTTVHPMLAETDFFSTAEKLTAVSTAALSAGTKQSAQTVARKMIHHMQKPCREVWPKPMSRLSLNIAVLLPVIVDAVLGKIRDKTLSAGAKSNQSIEEIKPEDIDEAIGETA